MAGLDGCQGSLYYAVGIVSYRINCHHKDSLSFFQPLYLFPQRNKSSHIYNDLSQAVFLVLCL